MKDVAGWVMGVLFLGVCAFSLYATCKRPDAVVKVVTKEHR